MTSQLLKGAQDLAFHRQSQCDSSHDQFHVLRVLKLSTLICLNHERTPDLLVVQLSTLFHDLLDRKYLPKELEGVSAHDYLAEFWAHWTERDVTTSQRRLVEDIISNVSYSKEVKRIKNREQTAFHETCIELHCVQDADKLDAIGAFGILRCASYSGSVSSNHTTPSPLSIPPSWPSPRPSTALDHFDDKLFKLEGMMRTEKGKTMARSRTEFMRTFVAQVNHEWAEIEEPL